MILIYVHEQAEVSWEAEALNWDCIIMFVLFLVRGTMKTIQIFNGLKIFKLLMWESADVRKVCFS